MKGRSNFKRAQRQWSSEFDVEEKVFVTTPQQAVSLVQDETAQFQNDSSTMLSWLHTDCISLNELLFTTLMNFLDKSYMKTASISVYLKAHISEVTMQVLNWNGQWKTCWPCFTYKTLWGALKERGHMKPYETKRIGKHHATLHAHLSGYANPS